MSDAAMLEMAEAMAGQDHPEEVNAPEWARAHIGRRDLIEADHHSRFHGDDWNACAEHGILATMVAHPWPRPSSVSGAGGPHHEECSERDERAARSAHVDRPSSEWRRGHAPHTGE